MANIDNGKTDCYIESVEIPDGSPQEMAQFFVNTANNAMRDMSRSSVSLMYDEVMPVLLNESWKMEIKGVHFVVLQWKTSMITPKDKFFAQFEPSEEEE